MKVADSGVGISPEFLPHILLRVRDVMRDEFPTARDDSPSR